jgi:hypothetical protein
VNRKTKRPRPGEPIGASAGTARNGANAEKNRAQAIEQAMRAGLGKKYLPGRLSSQAAKRLDDDKHALQRVLGRRLDSRRVEQSTKAPQTGAAKSGRRRQSKTPAEMRSLVLRRCTDELRVLANGKESNPDALLRGLRSIAAEMVADREALKAVERGYQLLAEIRDARDEARRLIESLQGSQSSNSRLGASPWNDLASLVELLSGRQEFHFYYPEGTVNVTHREVVLRYFDNGEFLGRIGRHATVRELALLSLFLDPDQGVHEGRGTRQTWWAALKAEEDAIRIARKRLRKSDPLYGK